MHGQYSVSLSSPLFKEKVHCLFSTITNCESRVKEVAGFEALTSSGSGAKSLISGRVPELKSEVTELRGSFAFLTPPAITLSI